MDQLLVGLAIGFIVAFISIYLYFGYLIRKISAQLDAELHSRVEEKLLPVIAERHDNMIYLYTEQDHTFVAQGNTVRELREAIAARYPGKVAYVADGSRELLKELSDSMYKDLNK